ncbi:MAG: ATP-binding protein [Streptosporangiaceae bacterium]|jgi:signal transduction histidine kinase
MTGMSVDRQHDRGERPAPAGAAGLGTAGLLHDLGHQIMTVSLLAESLQADAALSPESRRRSELVVQETARALGMLADGAAPAPAVAEELQEQAQLIDARLLADQVARLAGMAYPATVALLPGPPAYMQISPMLVWRVLWNLVENAARAAGPAGRVEIAVRRAAGTIIEVTDDGPGYGNGAQGMAGLGLRVVRQLVAASGGQLEIGSGPGGGTRMRAEFGARCDRIALPPMRQARRAAG